MGGILIAPTHPVTQDHWPEEEGEELLRDSRERVPDRRGTGLGL